jgi:hypothetical protein
MTVCELPYNRCRDPIRTTGSAETRKAGQAPIREADKVQSRITGPFGPALQAAVVVRPRLLKGLPQREIGRLVN